MAKTFVGGMLGEKFIQVSVPSPKFQHISVTGLLAL
jgi:hypothetical protein